MESKAFMPNDLVEVYQNGTHSGYFFVDDVQPDVKPGWWIIYLDLVNSAMLFGKALSSSFILDNEQMRGEEFTMKGERFQIKLFVGASSEPQEKEVKPETLIPLL